MTRKILTSILLISASLCLEAKTLRNLTADCSGSIGFVADSIEYRPDVTRLYGKIKGRPHTANRIDTLYGTFGKIKYSSTDIDGVDMKRYFQWEDNGLIPVEIDFPVVRTQTSFVLTLDGPRGESTWNIRSSNGK